MTSAPQTDAAEPAPRATAASASRPGDPQGAAPGPGAVPYLEHLQQESARFREAIVRADPDAPVPTCPEWTADDLLWHLADVQWFWGEVAERRVTTDEELHRATEGRPNRPEGREALLRHFDAATTRLHRALAALPPETPLWMWADDRTAGYVMRRQAREALVHRLDAELTAGLEVTRADCRLVTDGTDEALRVMHGLDPATEPALLATALSGPVVITAVQGMESWTVTPTRFTGTSRHGSEVDVKRLVVEAGCRDDAVATVSGAAHDLDRWLWHRPLRDPVVRHGDERALAALDSVVARDLT